MPSKSSKSDALSGSFGCGGEAGKASDKLSSSSDESKAPSDSFSVEALTERAMDQCPRPERNCAGSKQDTETTSTETVQDSNQNSIGDKLAPISMESKQESVSTEVECRNTSKIVPSDDKSCQGGENTDNEDENFEYNDRDNDFEEESRDDKDTYDVETANVKTQAISGSVIQSPQKSKTSKHSQKKPKDDDYYKQKITELDKKIKKIASEREKVSPVKQLKRGRLPKLKVEKKKKAKQKKFIHSKLKFVMADVSVSPYMTAPECRYSQDTLRLPEILRDLRYDASSHELPFDPKAVEKKFVEEVYNYKKPNQWEVSPKKKKLNKHVAP